MWRLPHRISKAPRHTSVFPISEMSSTAKAGSAGPKIDGMPRFFKTVDVVQDSEGYYVTLDNKRLKTPLKNLLCVPTKSLAWAIAHEWDAQKDDGIRPRTMPLMSFTSTCLDDVDNAEEAVEEVFKYFGSDTVCFDASKNEPRLLKQQQKHWSSLRKWFEEEFNGTLGINDGIVLGRLKHCQSLHRNVREYVESLNIWQLMALRSITRDCKSLVIGMALLKREFSIEKAIATSRVEEETQIEDWGLVEGGHDVDRANINSNVAAASVFLWLTESSTV